MKLDDLNRFLPIIQENSNRPIEAVCALILDKPIHRDA